MTVSIHGKEFEVGQEPQDYWGWVAEGRYDREWKLYDEYLKPEHTFLDLGAWIGSHSLYASRIAKEVIAVEPDPVAYKIMAANTEHVVMRRRQEAIGVGGTITLGSGYLGASTTRANPKAGGGIGAWEIGHQFAILSTTLRDFVEREKLTGPLFIKMDVEGSEDRIIEDLEFFRERKPTVYIELHPWWWDDALETRTALTALMNLYSTAKQLNRDAYLLNG